MGSEARGRFKGTNLIATIKYDIQGQERQKETNAVRWDATT